MEPGEPQVKAEFMYLKPSPLWTTTKPYFINIPDLELEDESTRSNKSLETISDVPVRDMRQVSSSLDLDTYGFTFLKHPVPDLVSMCADEETAAAKYAAELESFVRETFGVEHLVVLLVAVRRRDQSFPQRPWGESGYMQPIKVVHTDYSPSTARELTERLRLTGKYREGLGNRRVQVLQFWRPLRGPLRDWPLAVLDSRSLDTEGDLLASDFINRSENLEGFDVFYNMTHRWYYLSEQTPDEVIAFKGYDSQSNVATVCPHAAFDLKHNESINRRDSIEAHVLVIYPEPGPAFA